MISPSWPAVCGSHLKAGHMTALVPIINAIVKKALATEGASIGRLAGMTFPPKELPRHSSLTERQVSFGKDLFGGEKSVEGGGEARIDGHLHEDFGDFLAG